MPPTSATSPALAPSTLPPRSTARSTSTEPGFIDFSGGEPRRGPARDQRGGYDDVLLLDVLGGKRRLLGLILFRHFLGIAACGFGLLELLVLDREEFGPQAFDLLFHRGPHVGGGDDGAQPPRARARPAGGN